MYVCVCECKVAWGVEIRGEVNYGMRSEAERVRWRVCVWDVRGKVLGEGYEG